MVRGYFALLLSVFHFRKVRTGTTQSPFSPTIHLSLLKSSDREVPPRFLRCLPPRPPLDTRCMTPLFFLETPKEPKSAMRQPCRPSPHCRRARGVGVPSTPPSFHAGSLTRPYTGRTHLPCSQPRAEWVTESRHHLGTIPQQKRSKVVWIQSSVPIAQGLWALDVH